MQFHLILSKIIAFFQRIGFGILLSVMQLGLIFLGINHLDTATIIIVGLTLYFVIPGLAGLRSARQGERRATGLSVGFVTGITCATIIMLILIIMAAIAITAPPPATPSRFPLPVSFLAVYLLEMALALNFLGVLLALIGGGLGGFIGRRWGAKPAQS